MTGLKNNALLVLFSLFTISIFSQEIRTKCSENISFEESQNNFTVYLAEKKINFAIPDKLIDFNSCKISVVCKNEYLNLIYTFNTGNDYKIVNTIFKIREGQYYWDKTFVQYANRNEILYTGFNGNNEKIEKFKIENDQDLEKYTEKEIKLVTGFQDKETEKIDYFKLVKKSYKSKNYNNVLLFTNEFLIDEFDSPENLKDSELNDIAFFAYQAKGYSEAIYILGKVIEKYPTRVVAYLNIADCYWETNQKVKAIESYNKYISLMKSQKRDLKKIPKYVYDRVRQ